EIRIIDVERACILTAPSNCKYLALSYVWGKDQPKLTMSTLTSWSQEGALLETQTPRTIRDAMVLTLELGERYLWVDSLCIIQDDPEHRKKQIEHMYIIYHRAYLTIIAAGGDDCDAGIPLLPFSTPRNPSQAIENINGLVLATVHYSAQWELEDSKWNTR